MAKPIKETPILEGKDAKKFLSDKKDSANKKVDAKEVSRLKENFSKLQSIAKF